MEYTCSHGNGAPRTLTNALAYDWWGSIPIMDVGRVAGGACGRETKPKESSAVHFDARECAELCRSHHQKGIQVGLAIPQRPQCGSRHRGGRGQCGVCAEWQGRARDGQHSVLGERLAAVLESCACHAWALQRARSGPTQAARNPDAGSKNALQPSQAARTSHSSRIGARHDGQMTWEGAAQNSLNPS